MDYYNLGVWFTAGVCLSESVRRRGEIVAVIGNTVAELMLVSVQVTYSQTLGLIGYSLLPLVIVAPIVSLLQSYPWMAFLVKVRLCVVGGCNMMRGCLLCIVRV